jgi:hypothetical protein
LPSFINQVKPWICEQERYTCALGTILCHKYMQLNFMEPLLQLNQWTSTETGATELGNSGPPGSAWTLNCAPDQQPINLQSIHFKLF